MKSTMMKLTLHHKEFSLSIQFIVNFVNCMRYSIKAAL